MRREYLALWSFLLLVLTISGVIYLQKERNRDEATHTEALLTLYKLKDLDTRLDRDLLHFMSFQLNHYDTLADAVMQTRALQAALVTFGDGLDGRTWGTFNLVLNDYTNESEVKLALLEHLKSKASILRNSLQYLPLAVQEVRSTAEPGESQYASRLLAKLLNYNLFPDEGNRLQVVAHIDSAKELFFDLEAAPQLRNILAHANAVLDNRTEIERLMERYKAIPIQVYTETMLNQLHKQDLVMSSRFLLYNSLLLVTVVLILIALGYALLYLRNERQRAEGAWQQLRNAIESISEAFAFYDVNDRLQLWNSRFAEFYAPLRDKIAVGLPFRTLLETGIERGIFDRGDMAADEFLDQLYARHVRGEQGVIQKMADGRRYMASDNRVQSGGITSICVDITEQDKLQERLHELSQAVEQSPVSIIITDIEGNIEYVNEKFIEVSGYSLAEVIGKNPRFLKSGHKTDDDYKHLWEAIVAGKEWQGEFQNIRKNGGLYWESARISPIRNADGQITHYLAIKEEITAQKKAREQLRLAAKVFDTTSEAIMVTGADTRIKAINPGFTLITGYTEDEIIGKTPDILSSGHHGPDFYRDMWQSLREHGGWEGEIWNRRKSGQIYPEWLSIASIKNDDGKVVEYVAMFSDITQRKKDEEKIRWQANYDPLTELPNRNLFFDRLARALASAKREGWVCALLFIDLDRFKVVNDTLGHATGDSLLKQVARRLVGCVRDVDTVARLSGDEFMVILQHIGNANSAMAVAEEILSAMSERYMVGSHEFFIGASIGITLYPDDGDDASVLMRNADLAMYQAKSAGRNMYRFFTNEINEQMLGRMRLEHDMRLAIERREFQLHYQPIVSVITRDVVAAEVLVRWNHPEYGMLGPDKFIGLAEETGLIGELGEWILRTACIQAMAWYRETGLVLRISVNLSNRQLQKGFSVERLKSIMNETGINPEMLTLEITESVIMDDSSNVIEMLAGIRAMGVGISIDDFGTGFSSLSYLKRLPITALKIDKSFIDDITTNFDDAALTRAIIGLARNFDLQVIAEGVETRPQLAILEKMRCDMVQGYIFSRPLPPDEFLHHLDEQRQANI